MTLRARFRRWLQGPPEVDVCVGFDGVLHDPATASPLAPYPAGEAIVGAVALLRELLADNVRVAVLVPPWARVAAVRAWFARRIPEGELRRLVFDTLPVARAYLLDRAVAFHGVAPTAERLRTLTPWWAPRVRLAGPSGSPRPSPGSPRAPAARRG